MPVFSKPINLLSSSKHTYTPHHTTPHHTTPHHTTPHITTTPHHTTPHHTTPHHTTHHTPLHITHTPHHTQHVYFASFGGIMECSRQFFVNLVICILPCYLEFHFSSKDKLGLRKCLNFPMSVNSCIYKSVEVFMS